MHDSPFEHISGNAAFFSTPQIEDTFQITLNEISNFRLLSCVLGFPKSGKTVFLERLSSMLKIHTIGLKASRQRSLSKTLTSVLDPQGESKSNLARRLREKKRIVILIDDAHLLKDDDFAFVKGLYTLAEHQRTVLQIVLVGNTELLHRLTRPENREIHAMLGKISNLPKLSREQSLSYIRFLLDSAGLAQDIIPNPVPLAQKAAGVIGVLRMLTITLALKALSGQPVHNAEEILALKPKSQSQGLEDLSDEDMPVQSMVTTQSPWIGRILLLTMTLLIGAFYLAFRLLIPEGGMDELMHSNFKNVLEATKVAAGPNGTQNRLPALGTEEPGNAISNQPVIKTVFRKRTNNGPYSVQLGTYPSIEALVLHLPRYTHLKQPLFWNREQADKIHYALFVGRFDDFTQASRFASQQKLGDAPVAFRPFTSSVGPISDSINVLNTSYLLGLPSQQPAFQRDLVSGVEIQFALTRTREEALDRCQAAEAKGLPCAVTQFE